MTEALDNKTVRAPGVIRWWDAPVAFIGGTLFGILLIFIAGVIALIMSGNAGSPLIPLPERILLQLQSLLLKSFAANYVILFLSDLGLLAGIWFVARWRIAKPVAHYFSPIGVTTLTLALLTGAVLSIAINGGNVLFSRLTGIAFDETASERILAPHTPPQFAATIAVVVLFAPFVEEFFFRGLFFAWLRQTGGLWLASAVSSLTFAALHGQFEIHPGVQGWLYSAELLIAGVVLAAWAVRAGSLRASLATHAAFNLAATLIGIFLP